MLKFIRRLTRRLFRQKRPTQPWQDVFAKMFDTAPKG
jgi:hypothetical protein